MTGQVTVKALAQAVQTLFNKKNIKKNIKINILRSGIQIVARATG